MKTIYVFIICMLSFNMFGQIGENQKAFIDVIGKAVTEISPNEVHIALCLEEYMKGDKKISLSVLETNLKTELAKNKIPPSNLYISDINSVITKTGWFSQESLSTGSYSLKVTKVEKIKEVFKIFEKLHIVDAKITKASHSEFIKLRKENRIKAIKAAKEKADYLLKAIGAKTGKPLKVTEEVNVIQNLASINYNNNSRGYAMNSVSKFKSMEKDNVQFENIKLEATIHVVFEIQ